MVARETVYQVVAARRLQWDALVWQVPVLSLTAQAFLFTISLDPGTSRTARVMASLLSLVITFLSIELMSRHRQAEIMDARWLEAVEEETFGRDDVLVVHGDAYRRRRNSTPSGPLGGLKGYWTWLTGLSLFGLAALFVLVVVAFKPSLLQ